MSSQAASSDGGIGLRSATGSARRRHELGFSEGDSEMFEMERMGSRRVR